MSEILLNAENLSLTYPGQREPTFHDVSLQVRAGEMVVLTGPSGAGKTSLLHALLGVAADRGAQVSGNVNLMGRPIEQVNPRTRAECIGWVGQEPSAQRVAGKVGDEVAFAQEAVERDSGRIQARASELLQRVGLGGFDEVSGAELSGGQLQRVMIAGGMSAGARLLMMDEPCAQLDPKAARELLQMLSQLCAEGVGVLIIEHRVEVVRPYADRMLCLEHGILRDGEPTGVDLPYPRLPGPKSDAVCVEIQGGPWRWPGSKEVTLTAPTLTLHRGERVAIVGDNGAGKSTWLGLIRRRLKGSVGGVSVPQDPDLALCCGTVRQELSQGPRERGESLDRYGPRLDQVAAAFHIAHLLDRPPLKASRGQRLRIAVAAAVMTQPPVLLLDEPTSGQDRAHVIAVMEALALAAPDTSIVFASHDMDLVRALSDRVYWLESGAVRDHGKASAIVERFEHREQVPVAAPEPLTGSQGFDPRARLILCVVVSLLAIILEHAPSLGLLAAMSIAAVFTSVKGWKRRAMLALSVLVSVWGAMLSQGLFYAQEPRVPALVFGPVTVWREGLIWGARQGLRMVAVFGAGAWLCLTTPPDRLLLALRSMKMPFGLSFMVAAAVRAVPELVSDFWTVRVARRERGRPAWKRAPWSWLAVEVSLWVPVVVRAWRRRQDLAISLGIRGFEPSGARGVRQPLRWKTRDTLLLSLLGTVFFLAASGRLLYSLYVSGLYYNPRWRDLYEGVRYWL